MIGIVGAGAAGWSAALKLQALGCEEEVCIFDHEVDAPYERPVLSKEFLTGADDRPRPLPGVTGPQAAATRLIARQAVVSIDRAARTVTGSRGERFGYRQLLLAPGSDARRLTLPGAELDGVHRLRDAADARRLRSALSTGRRMVVLGGGVVGLEVASSARARGCEVVVIEAAAQILGRNIPAPLATVIADSHREQGIDIRTDARPVAIEGSAGMVAGVRLEDGSFIPAAAVLVGIGAEPRVRLAEDAGLEVADGVIVDEHFRTDDPHIYAAGDVAGVYHVGAGKHLRLEQWEVAREQGAHAAASMLGAREGYRDVPWMWSDQGVLHIQATGFEFSDASTLVRRGQLGDREGVAYFGIAEGRLVAACGTSIGPAVGKTIRIAQRLIRDRVQVDAERLADQHHGLKALLRESVPTQ